MMFLNINEKKEKANAISYKIDEYIWGRKDFVTDCPYGEKGRYTNAINNLLAELKKRLKISIFLWRKSCASR